MTDLKQRLEAAADDTGRGFSTDLHDLLDRARRARRRARLRTTGAAVVATALAVAIPMTAVQVGRTPGAAANDPQRGSTAPSRGSATVQTPSQDPTPEANVVLDESEIVSRCATQLAKYNELPRWRGGAANPVVPPVPVDAWFVVHQDRTGYRAGDVVAIGETKYKTLQRLCLIPEDGHEDDPVPFDAFVPGPEQHELITQVCSEAEVVPGRGGPDVRDVTVLAAQRAGDVLVAAMSRGPDFFACTIPLAGISDRVPFEIRGPLRPSRGTTIGVGVSAVGPKGAPTSTYYWANGFLPRDVAKISFQVRGQAAVEFPVRDGAFAFAVEVPITVIAPSRYRLIDAQGRVLHTSSWTQPRP